MTILWNNVAVHNIQWKTKNGFVAWRHWWNLSADYQTVFQETFLLLQC